VFDSYRAPRVRIRFICHLFVLLSGESLVRSYIEIYGPPLLKAINALEAVAVDVSGAVDIKFSHRCMPAYIGAGGQQRDWDEYLQRMKETYVNCYEPMRLISESGEMRGNYDFFYEWTNDPTMEQIKDLIEKIDKALTGLGCNYTITTE